ncbi:hypothetical protein NBRC3278_3406 [Acetobacter pasteurianus NBRC 3278]|uniref:Uncharacterized protein n=1 Tax=Acetobacter pasteurianus NBRC 3278 TaxID=1226660 RepID=A0A401X986_ACEPA|nr:hypothetical protein NBRC3277_3085 [Acetobacter pasteurianus NBRC 3277]GCD64313.1 hypothetical protein NBRC3278_3406 [Acetobacter pasteurianus NBRC 3278]
MHDRFARTIQHPVNRIQIGTRIEIISQIQLFQILIPVQLLIVGVGNCLEFPFIFRGQHSNGIPTEIGAGHGNDVRFPTGNQLVEIISQPVFRVGTDMVKFIHRHQTPIKCRNTQFFRREPECRVGANQSLVFALQKLTNSFDLGACDLSFIGPWCVAQIPFRLDDPVGPEAEFAQGFVHEAPPDRAFRHDDQGFFHPLMRQLVEGNKHQGTGFTRSRR